MRNLSNKFETRGSNRYQFKNVSSKVNTVQCDKISSN